MLISLSVWDSHQMCHVLRLQTKQKKEVTTMNYVFKIFVSVFFNQILCAHFTIKHFFISSHSESKESDLRGICIVAVELLLLCNGYIQLCRRHIQTNRFNVIKGIFAIDIDRSIGGEFDIFEHR